jgi:hypothetical protein
MESETKWRIEPEAWTTTARTSWRRIRNFGKIEIRQSTADIIASNTPTCGSDKQAELGIESASWWGNG